MALARSAPTCRNRGDAAQQIEQADAVFTRLVEAAPQFADGTSARRCATSAKTDAGSIADCREALARNPNHFGALSAKRLCRLAVSAFREAADLFRRTLAVHPHLESGRANLGTAVNGW